MKKFELIFSIVCYTLAVLAFVMIFICAFCFEEKPTALFYTTMALSIVSMVTNGSLFMWYYKEN